MDLNVDDVQRVALRTHASRLNELYLPKTVLGVDFLVSMPKMKTHHWAGVTLSLKNMFGVVPGSCYGWPKNVLHWAGIDRAILDINAAVRPDFAIVDGIVGMEGNGPIQGVSKACGLLIWATTQWPSTPPVPGSWGCFPRRSNTWRGLPCCWGTFSRIRFSKSGRVLLTPEHPSRC